MSGPVASPAAAAVRSRRSVPPSREEARRRRRRALAALGGVGALALVVGIAVWGAGGAGERSGRRGHAAGPLERRSLEQRVGQTLMLSFKGKAPPAYVLDILREGRAAGVVLFGDNTGSPDQLRRLTRRLQDAAHGDALIAADQEGGDVRILRWAGPVRGQTAQPDARAAATAARAAGHDLAAAGVNTDLAPVADVRPPGGSAVGGRAFPGDPRAVAASTDAAVRGLGAARVAATAKHFPGFGSAQANTDDEPVTIDLPREELLTRDVEPFRAAIAAGAPLVMASHALYPALDGQRIASQSPVVLGDLLRRQLGFRGAVVTDSLEAEAVRRRGSVDRAAVRSLAAGADLLLMTGPGSFAPVRDRVLARARRDPVFRRRVDDAAERVLAVKRGLGLPSPGPPRAAR